jgi:hypothetical protein
VVFSEGWKDNSAHVILHNDLRDEITVLPFDFHVIKRQPNGVPSHCMSTALKDVSEEFSNAFFHIINDESCYTTIPLLNKAADGKLPIFQYHPPPKKVLCR